MKSITAIICITALVMFAVWQGHNSAIVGAACAGIAGIAGYQVGKAKESKRQNSKPKD